MNIETIVVDGTEHEIVVKPITIVVKDAGITTNTVYKDRLPLDLEACLYHMDRVQKFDSRTPYFVSKVFPQLKEEVNPTTVRANGLGVRHFAGRIDMTLKLMDQGVPIAWVYPEAGLHPSSQLILADVIIELTLPKAKQ
jgi:hypothetical protein